MIWYFRLSKGFPQFSTIHTVKGFGIVNEIEVDGFLESRSFPYDPANVDNLISGSSFFSKPSLDMWKFFFHIMLKPSIQDFTMLLLVWEMNAIVYWLAHSLVLSFLGIGMRIDLFQSCGHCSCFRFAYIFKANNLMALSFRILNSSTGIPSHPLALLTAVLPKVHLTLLSGISGSG